MPRLIPELNPDKIGNKGEREVYVQLRAQLPDDWIVRYHYPACWMQGTCLRDCEADFILVAPGRGVLLLEVKSSFGYECVDGIWYRVKENGTREETKSPVDQAMGTSHRLVERLAQDLFGCRKEKFPGTYGYLVVYPFARAEGALPKSFDPRLIVGYKDMARLRERIEETFDLWSGGRRIDLFNNDAARRVGDFLSDRCNFVPVLAGDVDADEAAIKQLTLQQYQAFKSILSNPRVLTQGTAGSGKTMIALWAAQAIADEGQRVLLVCFNRLLARWLQHNCLHPNVTVRSFFSLCRERVTNAKLEFRVPTDRIERDRFWTQLAPELFNQALSAPSSPELFDAVFVDEAQDFHANWWVPVQLLLKDADAGRLYLFLDPDQTGVYGNGDQYPDAGMTRFDLAENCRNTRRIARYCGSIITRDIKSFELSPVGTIPEIWAAVPDPSHRAQVVRRLVSNLLIEGFQPSRIAILSPWDPESTGCALNYLAKVGQVPIESEPERFQQWLDGRAIWGGTIKSFKGLEADCVVVTDVPVPDSKACSLADLYVAASRAKHRLAIVPASSEAERSLQVWADKLKNDLAR